MAGKERDPQPPHEHEHEHEHEDHPSPVSHHDNEPGNYCPDDVEHIGPDQVPGNVEPDDPWPRD